MHPDNEDKFRYCRIPAWWNMGYTGKGIKVAVLEDITDGHGRMVADIIRQVLPDAEILNRPHPGPIEYVGDRLAAGTRARIESFFNSLVAEGVNICVMSLGGTGAKEMEELERFLISNGVVLFTSAGNDGGPIDQDASAALDTWISVGAAILVKGQPRRVDYSEYGPQLDVVGFTSLATSWGGVFNGTSCANPFVAGMCGLWFQWFREQHGRTPNQAETLEFIRANSEDLGEPGRDDMHGYGLLRLPEQLPDTILQSPEATEPKKPVASGFTDIAGHWAAKDIEKCVNCGLMKGYPDGTFGPDKPITRAEIATILMRLVGGDIRNE